MINEIAWSGTLASSSDEWIELLNTTNENIDLSGWILTDGDDLQLNLRGSIAPNSFFLLERTDDNPIASISADQIYSGNLRNEGETIRLFDPGGSTVDSANIGGGSWPAGDSGSRSTMERRGGEDQSGNWVTYSGWGGSGHDIDGNPIRGTPRQHNSIFFASPTPSLPPTTGAHYPSQFLLINEIAWAGTAASSSDEWIELFNPNTIPVDLTGWSLSDDGDTSVILMGKIAAYSYFLLERTDDNAISNIAADLVYSGNLNNNGERLELRDPSGVVIDSADGSSGWPAGNRNTHASMERLGGADVPGNWTSFNGNGGGGLDALGGPVPGTPRQMNSPFISPPSPTPTSQPAIFTPLAVMINEVAWAGTHASANDEWIELHNPGTTPIDLAGWVLSDGSDLRINLAGTITAHSFYLLERTNDETVQDIHADQIYSGGLRNDGEVLKLQSPSGTVIDSANLDGGSWPGGNQGDQNTMERLGGEDRSGNWGTFTGWGGNGHDAHGMQIQGTPRQPNSVLFPTPVPTWVPGKIVINEVLIRPHYDWEGTGGINPMDEFIELLNLGPFAVNLRGWWLDDIADAGSAPYKLPGVTIRPGEFVAFFRSRTRIALNDGGDSVRLLSPDARVIDQISYLRVRAYNLSYGRLPDGSGHLYYGLWPTAGEPNRLFLENVSEIDKEIADFCVFGEPPMLRFPRLGRHPELVNRLMSQGHLLCSNGQFDLADTERSPPSTDKG
ncbi:MAG TPA: lamin tail domain-containing protein [Anaerolineales bacterium]|nr:lamin tail domain-containing protein [Anaerolineales bacterium]